MIHIGQHNDLKILRQAPPGLYLWDGTEEEVLLPNKYCPEEFDFGDDIRVFVYLDAEERKVATTLEPKILLNQFAFLEVVAVEPVGAFVDWGLEKQLLVPFKEQRERMKLGRWYVVYMSLDEETDRLFASNKLNKYLSNEELSVEESQEVDLIVTRKTNLGYEVIINHLHKGLIYENEVFQTIRIGDALKGYIKLIREDHKIDISLQPIGYQHFNDVNTQMVYDRLVLNNGRLPLSDKSAPAQIYATFGISKKAFKKAIGALYKAKKIEIGEMEISLVE